MSIKTVYQEARRWLQEAKVDSPELDARLIVRHVLGVTDADLIEGTGAVSAAQMQAINTILQRRRYHVPLSRIFGTREFWSLPFIVTPDVLDPRPDTETLVEAALKSFTTPPATILDLGTGTGCILIALLHEWPEARGTGVDISGAALDVAAENARINGVADRVEFVQADWNSPDFLMSVPSPLIPLPGERERRAKPDRERGGASFDLIVSNPPYIPSGDIPNLATEVKNHDPILALDGGKDGLQAYLVIIRETKKLLSPAGVCLLETGIGQVPDVTRLAAESGLSVSESIRDLAGIERVLKITTGDSGDN